METKLTPPTTAPDTPWKEGTGITKGQVFFILENKKSHNDAYVIAAINQARLQELFSVSLVQTVTRKIESGASGDEIIALLYPPLIPIVSS